MKEFYIRDAAQQENKVVTTSFVVASKQTKSKKSGEPYLDLTLMDRTGTIQAKMWDNVEECTNSFEQDDIVKVKGLINRYNQRWQLTLHKVRKMDEDEIDFGDYLPKTTRNVDELWRELGVFVASMQDAHLRQLLELFMADAEIERAYRNAPAAKTMHHAFIGGLLDHVCSLFRVCDLASRNYAFINRDLLLTGAFLHDIGKVRELSYARSFGYTDEGQLLGHIIIDLEMLHAKLAQIPGFPPKLKMLVEHLIISHHGQYDFGSPKLPMFPEALMLHYLDDMDSKMEAMRGQFERDAELETAWTAYNPALGRPLLNTEKYLRQAAEQAGDEAAETEKAPTEG
jgi:3'-5' exoribonuclease